MKKLTSKRRWIARWKIGQWIPYVVLVHWPDLKGRFQPYEAAINRDCIRRVA